MAQDPATADPPFDLESSYYGPGAMAVWYLMFLCLFIKTGQTGHPSKKLSASPDIVIYVLYACLAAGHMAIQITHFDSDAIDQLNGFFFAHFMPPNRRRILQEFPPELQKMVATLNASFQVGVIFLWVVTFPLLFMGYVDSPEVPPKRRRHLLWVMLLPWLWVLGCFCFLASRCRSGSVFWAMGSYSAEQVAFFIYVSALCVPVAIILWGFYKGGSYVFSLLVEKETCHLILVVPCMALAFLVMGSFAWEIPQFIFILITDEWFPEVGVKLSALDQILGLGTGIITLAFTVRSVEVGRRERAQALPA